MSINMIPCVKAMHAKLKKWCNCWCYKDDDEVIKTEAEAEATEVMVASNKVYHMEDVKLDKVKEESDSSSEYYDSEEEIIEERN